MNEAISIYEVGPRDGLQSLEKNIPVRKRVKLVRKLKEAGLDSIEVGSLVHPSVINMKDSEKVYSRTGGDLLIMNRRGLERAKEVGAKKLNVVLSPLEDFNKKNQNTTLSEAMSNYEEMSKETIIQRVYISCAFHPDVSEEKVLECVRWADKIGEFIVLCDTDSHATPESVSNLCTAALEITPKIGVHFHLSEETERCIEEAYNSGVRVFDTSIGGLGGCVAITSANGNISTENLVLWAHGKHIPIKQDIDVKKLNQVGRYANSLECSKLQRASSWFQWKIGLYI